ncbi:serine protease [Brevundimonas sp.]|uniref:S1 family peptidase n=1 Tax=Brevundimonas sp. TaxID=1871086 RepID=UPI002D2CF9FB|nr:serine protease [Brevundimonas sp.]HYD28616.1 serine protease [Brevundimonas sp.]
MPSPSEQMLYNSVRIAAMRAGQVTSYGTGFYFNLNVGPGVAPLLITNKHVIDGADGLSICVHQALDDGSGPSGTHHNVTISLREGGIVRHLDPSVDLCAITVGELVKPGSLGGKNVYAVFLDESLIPDAQMWTDLDALEEVVMVGCPNGLFDGTNGMPIMRRGTTASHPALPYDGRQEFMIDAACFPGSSGSPIYLFNSYAFYNKARGGIDMGTPRIKLLGILYAGPTIDQRGRIVLTKDLDVSVQSMMHLGSAIRSTRILELADEIRKRLSQE